MFHGKSKACFWLTTFSKQSQSLSNQSIAVHPREDVMQKVETERLKTSSRRDPVNSCTCAEAAADAQIAGV